jgi:hypothetical protein
LFKGHAYEKAVFHVVHPVVVLGHGALRKSDQKGIDGGKGYRVTGIVSNNFS